MAQSVAETGTNWIDRAREKQDRVRDAHAQSLGLLADDALRADARDEMPAWRQPKPRGAKPDDTPATSPLKTAFILLCLVAGVALLVYLPSP